MKTVIEKFRTTISTKYFIFQTFLLTLSLVFKADIKFTLLFWQKFYLNHNQSPTKWTFLQGEFSKISKSITAWFKLYFDGNPKCITSWIFCRLRNEPSFKHFAWSKLLVISFIWFNHRIVHFKFLQSKSKLWNFGSIPFHFVWRMS